MKIDRLLNKASKLGAKGIEVVGYLPPKTPSDCPDGTLITKNHANESCLATEPQWFDK